MRSHLMHRRPCRSQNWLIYTTVIPKVLTNLSVYSGPSQLYYFSVRMNPLNHDSRASSEVKPYGRYRSSTKPKERIDPTSGANRPQAPARGAANLFLVHRRGLPRSSGGLWGVQSISFYG